MPTTKADVAAARRLLNLSNEVIVDFQNIITKLRKMATGVRKYDERLADTIEHRVLRSLSGWLDGGAYGVPDLLEIQSDIQTGYEELETDYNVGA